MIRSVYIYIAISRKQLQFGSEQMASEIRTQSFQEPRSTTPRSLHVLQEHQGASGSISAQFCRILMVRYGFMVLFYDFHDKQDLARFRASCSDGRRMMGETRLPIRQDPTGAWRYVCSATCRCGNSCQMSIRAPWNDQAGPDLGSCH